jgi:hypothetical protein
MTRLSIQKKFTEEDRRKQFGRRPVDPSYLVMKASDLLTTAIVKMFHSLMHNYDNAPDFTDRFRPLPLRFYVVFLSLYERILG